MAGCFLTEHITETRESKSFIWMWKCAAGPYEAGSISPRQHRYGIMQQAELQWMQKLMLLCNWWFAKPCAPWLLLLRLSSFLLLHSTCVDHWDNCGKFTIGFTLISSVTRRTKPCSYFLTHQLLICCLALKQRMVRSTTDIFPTKRKSW